MKKYIPALTIAFFILIYLVPLGVRPLLIPDETRYAEAPREMIESGNWVSPRLIGLRYFEKPIMGYWFNAASMRVFGENRFALRLPSVLAAALTALAIYFFLLGCGLRRFEAFFPVIVYLLCSEVFFVGTFAVFDTYLTMFTTISLALFYLACMEKKILYKIILLAIFGSACGCAFLVKGFLAFAVPVIVIVPFMLWEKKWKELFILPWIPILTALITVLPWSLAVHWREPDFWNYFFWVEHIQRFRTNEAGQHPENIFYFIPVIIGGLLPWTFLLPAAFKGYVKSDLKNPLIRYCLCWLVFPFLFFSASSGKLATYILPCFPAAAILISKGLINCGRVNIARRFYDIPALIMAGIFGLVAVSALPAFIIGLCFPAARIFAPAEIWKLIMLLAAATAWALILLRSTQLKEWKLKITLFCIAPLTAMFFYPFVLPDRILEKKCLEPLFEKNAHRVRPDSMIVCYKNSAVPAAWYLKRRDIYVIHKGGELQYALKNYEDSKDKLLSAEDFKKLIKNKDKNRHVILIMHAEKKEDLGIPEGKNPDRHGIVSFSEY